jgi:HlyD family secretion protein
MTAIIQDTSAQDTVLEPVRLGKKLPKIVAVIALVIGLLGYFAYEFSSVFGGDRVLSRDNLRLATVRGGDLVRDIVPQGRVVAADSPTLYAMDSGTVDLQIKAGDKVERGQVLAQIISPALNEELQREKSNLQRLQIELEGAHIQSERRKLELQQREEMAEVNLKAMDREQRRAEAAFEMQIISSLDYEEASDNLARARLEYRQAQQNNSLENESLEFDQHALNVALESQQMAVEALQRRVDQTGCCGLHRKTMGR